MHSKQTVKYICEIYPSGNRYYYKTEVITYDRWDQLDSLGWSTPRPITEATFKKREKEGYRVVYVKRTKPPAEVIPLKKVNKT